jgi:hypothetical protein
MITFNLRNLLFFAAIPTVDNKLCLFPVYASSHLRGLRCLEYRQRQRGINWDRMEGGGDA